MNELQIQNISFNAVMILQGCGLAIIIPLIVLVSVCVVSWERVLRDQEHEAYSLVSFFLLCFHVHVCLIIFLCMFLCKTADVMKALVKRGRCLNTSAVSWALQSFSCVPIIPFSALSQGNNEHRWLERIALAVHIQNPEPAVISLDSEVHPHHATEICAVL